MYQNKSRGIVGTIIWCVLCGISVMPAVVLWGITFDTKTYRKMDDPVAMRIMYLVFAIVFTAPFVVFFIKGAHAVFTRRISDLFTADTDGFVPVSELAKALGYTEDKTISKVTKMIRKGYLINCNYSANQRANNPFVGVHCPGCAASLKIRANTMGTCPYCGRLITAPYYDQNTNTFR